MAGAEKIRMVKTAEKRHKVVVRHLPWNLTAEGFEQIVKENISGEILGDVTWRHYEKGKLTRMKLVPSFAVLMFSNEDSIQKLHEQFDGRSFTDSKGYTSKATVEFAPIAQVPGDAQPDPKSLSSIEDDEEYKEFIRSLDAQKTAATSKTEEKEKAEQSLNEWIAQNKDEKGRTKIVETVLTESVKEHLWGRGGTGLRLKKRRGGGRRDREKERDWDRDRDRDRDRRRKGRDRNKEARHEESDGEAPKMPKKISLMRAEDESEPAKEDRQDSKRPERKQDAAPAPGVILGKDDHERKGGKGSGRGTGSSRGGGGGGNGRGGSNGQADRDPQQHEPEKERKGGGKGSRSSGGKGGRGGGGKSSGRGGEGNSGKRGRR